jgi:hypothetical protein
VAKGEAKGVEWYMREAEAGDAGVLVSLGGSDGHGRGVTKGEAKAFAFRTIHFLTYDTSQKLIRPVSSAVAKASTTHRSEITYLLISLLINFNEGYIPTTISTAGSLGVCQLNMKSSRQYWSRQETNL